MQQKIRSLLRNVCQPQYREWQYIYLRIYIITDYIL